MASVNCVLTCRLHKAWWFRPGMFAIKAMARLRIINEDQAMVWAIACIRRAVRVESVLK